MKDVGNDHLMASGGDPAQPPVRRLGFHEIVPGLGCDPAGEETSHPVDIPEFNLNHHMMARHRRVTARRRVGPKQKTDNGVEPSGYSAVTATATTTDSPVSEPGRTLWGSSPSPAINVLVARMVRRDIDRLCQVWAGVSMRR